MSVTSGGKWFLYECIVGTPWVHNAKIAGLSCPANEMKAYSLYISEDSVEARVVIVSDRWQWVVVWPRLVGRLFDSREKAKVAALEACLLDVESLKRQLLDSLHVAVE